VVSEGQPASAFLKIFLQIVLALLVLYLCGVAGAFFAGVIGALAATLLHATPYATVMIVRILSTVFFFGFVFLAWVIYSSRRSRRLRHRSDTA
jgi:hypothetical protein